jgi:thiol-disulfide isomerase/thioredoxin
MINKNLRNLFAGLAALLAGTASLLAAPVVGEAAPDFAVKDAAGKDVKLADYKGKVVVLEWYNPGCPFVKKFYEPGKMQELQKTYTGKGVVWLSIASTNKKNPEYFDGPGLIKKSAAVKASPTAIVHDVSGDLARLYAAKTTPHMFVISADGKLAYKGAIDSKPSASSGDIAKATPYLANAVDAVLAGKTPEPSETKSYGCGVKL